MALAMGSARWPESFTVLRDLMFMNALRDDGMHLPTLKSLSKLSLLCSTYSTMNFLIVLYNLRDLQIHICIYITDVGIRA